MKFIGPVLISFILGFSAHAENDQAIHPKPQEPKMISNALLIRLKQEMPPPPRLESAAQKQDEHDLRSFETKRTEADCQRAKSEVYVSLASFFGAPYGRLSSREVLTLAPFFEQVRNDADYYIQILKKEFPRPRPFLYLKGLNPCVPKEVTDAYPSGHSTLARLYALILKDIFPQKKEDIDLRSQVIATDRVLCGMHHPSDIKAGRVLGDLLYREFQKSAVYQKQFQEQLERLKLSAL